MQQEWGTGRSETDWQIGKQERRFWVSGLYNPQGLIHLHSVRWKTHIDIQDTAMRKCPELLYISLVSSFPKKCLIAALAQSPVTHQLVSTAHPMHNYLACLMVLHVPTTAQQNNEFFTICNQTKKAPAGLASQPPPLPQVFCILAIEIGEISTSQVLQDQSTSSHSIPVPIKYWI